MHPLTTATDFASRQRKLANPMALEAAFPKRRKERERERLREYKSSKLERAATPTYGIGSASPLL
eukprot:4625568-Pyramimonas_sp.AAC.1